MCVCVCVEPTTRGREKIIMHQWKASKTNDGSVRGCLPGRSQDNGPFHFFIVNFVVSYKIKTHSPSRTVAKTEDELKKYTLDPDLGQVARLHSLLQGNDVQKSVAGGALATLDPLNEPDAISLIMALTIAQTSSGESRQVQQDMGLGVIELINGTESLTTAIKDALTVLILAGVDSTNGQYWGMTLSTLLERLTYAEVKGKLGEIGSRSAMTTSEVGRTAITLTLGTLMKSLEGKPEQNDILQLTKELSNDVCLDVRQAASSQMDTIVCSLDKSSIPGTLLSKWRTIVTKQLHDKRS